MILRELFSGNEKWDSVRKLPRKIVDSFSGCRGRSDLTGGILMASQRKKISRRFPRSEKPILVPMKRTRSFMHDIFEHIDFSVLLIGKVSLVKS